MSVRKMVEFKLGGLGFTVAWGSLLRIMINVTTDKFLTLTNNFLINVETSDEASYLFQLAKRLMSVRRMDRAFVSPS